MHDERLAQSYERGGVHGPRLESRRVRVVIAASGRKLESRAPPEARRSEEREVAHPEPAGRERSVQPLVAERDDGVGSEVPNVDTQLSQSLRRVDDRDGARIPR